MIKIERAEKNNYYYDDAYKVAASYKSKFTESVYLRVWEFVCIFLPDDKHTEILDIGCGTGQLLDMLKFKGYNNISGFDFSDEAVKIANTNYPDIHIYKDNLYEHEVNTDVIVCTEVLEHIEKDCEMLEQWSRLVDQVVLTVPDFNDPSHLRYFQDCDDVALRYGKYFRTFDVKKIDSWFILNGKK
jgi:2-polyprenyl-3-methyl-5-hydroxy-6-metoxy-1,4-benzoquinol methylase